MSEDELYRRIIAGEAGAWSLPVRGLLRAAELLYAGGVAVRNRRYERRHTPTTLPVPVISVGNLTVGGTGKTPFVIELARRLDRMGKTPAVISRGYKSIDDAPNDEQRLIQRRCAGVLCLADPDRVRAGERACKSFGADVIVLDDGFQHRRLDRTLDIVLIDATCPFGFGHLLPRGLLREPVTSLRRADVVVLTRCDQVSPARLGRLDARLRTLVDEATHLQCVHRVVGVERLNGEPYPETLEGKRAVLFAAMAHPRAFATTVRALGVDVVASRWWPDHHEYAHGDIDGLFRAGRFPPYDLLMTTEKDAVKLVDIKGLNKAHIIVVRIDIDFVGDGGRMLQAVLDEAMGQDDAA